MQLVNHGCHLHCNLSGQVHDSAQNCIEWHWKLDVRRITRYPALVLMNYYAGNKGEIAFSSCLQCNLWMPALLLNPQSLYIDKQKMLQNLVFLLLQLTQAPFILFYLPESVKKRQYQNSHGITLIFERLFSSQSSSAALKTADLMEYHLKITL